MHLRAATPGTVSNGDEAIDLAQSPGEIGLDANPIVCPYFRTGSPSRMPANAILWPRGTRSRAVTPAATAPGAI